MDSSPIILPLPYFGNVLFYAVLFQHEHVIDVHENYRKQTYKNRCEVLTDQGLLRLTIPVIKKSGLKTPFEEAQIDLDDPWLKTHPRTLKAAYGSSPFYEFYIDDLMEIWKKPSQSLLENNLRCHQLICKIMEWELPLNFSKAYISIRDHDFRPYFIKENLDMIYTPYTQVFNDKQDFTPNMSILDLIFNLGPESADYLKKLIIKE